MDFIFMLTRNDRTVDDALSLVDAACDLGVRHIGFKDMGVPSTDDAGAGAKIHRRGSLCYLEVVSTTSEAALVRCKPVALSRWIGSSEVPISRAADASWATCRATFRFRASRSGIRRASADRRPSLPSIADRPARWVAAASTFSPFARREADPLDLVRAARERFPGRQADRCRQREFDATHSCAGRSRRRRLHDRIGRVRRRFLAREGPISRADPRHPGGLRQSAGAVMRGPATGSERGRRPHESATTSLIGSCRTPDERRPLDRLLRGEFPTRTAARRSRARQGRAIERSLRGIEADLVAPLGLGTPARGRQRSRRRARCWARASSARSRALRIVPVVLDGEPHADAEPRRAFGARARSATRS